MVNYGNGLIYKLCCNDTNIKEEYVGSTTDFTERKRCHKKNCNNPNSKQYNINVYKFIRDNGGFENFCMIQIEKYPCDSKRELETRERYWIETLESKLNCKIPTRTPKEWRVENSDKILEYSKEWRVENADKIKEWRVENADKLKEWRVENADKLKEKQKEYRVENADKLKERRVENADKIKEQNKKYYEENKDKLKEQKKEYYVDNADKLKEKQKEYYEENKDKLKEQNKKYYEENKDKLKEKKKIRVICECGLEVNKDHIARHRNSKKHKKFLEQISTKS
jgi:hypothetical protein